jgi:hypothetical protein
MRLIKPPCASRRDGHMISRTVSPGFSVALDQPRASAHCSGGPSPFHSSFDPSVRVTVSRTHLVMPNGNPDTAEQL